jgi:hypothetical protein
MIKDLTILIQGRCEQEQMQLWIDNYSDCNVIVSTWIDYDLNLNFPNNWKIIKSEYPKRFADIQNIDLQVISTLSGLKEVQTDYVIKVRGDEFFSNLYLVYNRMKEVHPKVLVSSIFFRRLGMYLYHISDHIICSTTENLNIMFEKTYDLLVNNIKFNDTPESHLGFSFISGKENWDLYEIEKYKSINDDMIRKWYSIFEISKLKPYIITQSTPNGRIYYKDNFEYDYHTITEL